MTIHLAKKFRSDGCFLLTFVSKKQNSRVDVRACDSHRASPADRVFARHTRGFAGKLEQKIWRAREQAAMNGSAARRRYQCGHAKTCHRTAAYGLNLGFLCASRQPAESKRLQRRLRRGGEEAMPHYSSQLRAGFPHTNVESRRLSQRCNDQRSKKRSSCRE